MKTLHSHYHSKAYSATEYKITNPCGSARPPADCVDRPLTSPGNNAVFFYNDASVQHTVIVFTLFRPSTVGGNAPRNDAKQQNR